MKTTFPYRVTRKGVSVTIGKVQKGGREFFRVLYREQGKRKQAWRSTFKGAKRAADDAIDATLTGDHSALKLNDSDRHRYLRAVEILGPFNVGVDDAAREYADLRAILGGRVMPIEACRDWLKRNAVELPKITVFNAVEQLKKQAETDGKSNDRQKQLSAQLDAFARAFDQEVHNLTSKMVSDYLTALPFKERTKRNHRDTLGFFNRWLLMRGYLAKGTDWLEGVQNYTARKIGEISVYSPDEMRRLIAAADARILPLIVIGGFGGLRHAEIARLDWQNIDLEDGFIEVTADSSKNDVRRTVPIKNNLKAFLLPLAKKSGKVISVVNTAKQLLKAAADTGDGEHGIPAIGWKHNALRHSFISYRIAECADAPRVAEEAGNSVAIIKTNYQNRRIRPAAAAEWFSIQPKL